MAFLKNPHLDLTKQIIETPRCILVPFSLDGRVDMQELTEEFCKANKDLFVNPFLPNYEQEIKFIEKTEGSIKNGETFENFILEKGTNQLIGCVGLNNPEENCMSIGLWIRVSEHRKCYAIEAYTALLIWARENVRYSFLKHALDPRNTASRKLALRFGGIFQNETDKYGSEIYYIPL